MPNPSPASAHVDEAFALAQLLSADRRDAVRLLERAIEDAGPGRGARFPLLRAVIHGTGLFSTGSEAPGPPHLPDAAPDDPADPGPADEPALPTGAMPTSLAEVLAGRDVLRRLVPPAVARLGPADRALAWLDASGLSNAADLGAVLGLSAPESLAWLVGSRTRLAAALVDGASESDRPLVRTALLVSEPGDLVRQALGPLFEPAPTSLRDRATPPPTPVGDRPRTRRRLAGFVRVAAFVVVAAAVGLSIRSFRPDPAAHPDVVTSDLVDLAVNAAEDLRPAFRSAGAEQAEVFILDRIGWRLVVPSIRGGRLEGVGVHLFDSATETPALVYDGSERVVVFVFTYAFLDRVSPTLAIDRAILDQVAEQGRFAVVDAGKRRALVFRNRDDVYVAVTKGDPVALRDAVSFPD